MPPLWSLGYHQCKWNYTQKELIEVSNGFKKHQIPCDSVWLDIEYADEKRYFKWDKKTFPDP
jgi:alpha 1,3-glucosidase